MGIWSDHFLSGAHLTPSGETAILKLLKPLKRETYDVYLRLLDQQGKSHLTILRATICECEGEVDECPEGRIAVIGAPIILAVLGAVLALLSEYAKGCPALVGMGFKRPGFVSQLVESHINQTLLLRMTTAGRCLQRG